MDIRCKRCLLREMANEDMYHRIQRTIDAIPPKLRCSKGEYDARLELCKECEKLIGGMCRSCSRNGGNYNNERNSNAVW